MNRALSRVIVSVGGLALTSVVASAAGASTARTDTKQGRRNAPAQVTTTTAAPAAAPSTTSPPPTTAPPTTAPPTTAAPTTTAPPTTAPPTTSAPSSPSSFSATSGRPFTSTSAWNSLIPGSPVIDSASSTIRSLITSSGKAYADYDELGIPVFDADASTPKYNVKCLMQWGTCGLSTQPVPIPNNAAPHTGSDGAMVVIDWSTRTSYEFWQASKINGVWQTSWGGKTSVDGDGVGGSSVGSGVSRLAGVVRVRELASGVIDHALVFSSSYTCSGTFRAPAIKTDGGSTAAGCIPEGARIQLDPSINVDAIPGITAGERAVGHAMQKYGAYCIDSGGSGMAFSFERLPGTPVYSNVGFGWDYFNMGHIPWSNLRVLRQWNGA